MKQEPKAIVKVQNQIIIMKQSSYMNLSPQFHRESHNAEANKHGIGADSPQVEVNDHNIFFNKPEIHKQEVKIYEKTCLDSDGA